MELGIHFHDVSFCYPGKTGIALDHVDLGIPQSSIYALLGPNGAGKTTLLRILSGRLHGYSGTLSFPESWRSADGFLDPRQYGVLVEHPGIYARLSVQEYLEFFGSFYPISNMQERIAHLANRIGFGNRKQRMGTLSLGMRQKVQIMRTFLHSPPLILLDEPTANLDPLAREALWSMVVQANHENGTTFIVCSHLLGEMEDHCTDMGFLRSGGLCASGSLEFIRKSHQASTRVTVKLSLPLQNCSLEENQFGIFDLAVHGSEIHYLSERPDRTNPAVIAFLVQNGAAIEEVLVHRPSLGEIYRHFVEEKTS